jgi:DNA-directed RNA polymerase subunit RPC12/RpoP
MDGTYVYICSHCGTKALVIGAHDPTQVTCDRCSPVRLWPDEADVTRDEAAS